MFFRIMSEILPCCWDTPSFFLRRHLFLVCHSVICPCWLGLRWLFIPSLLMLKVSCAIIPDYSTGKWQATTVQHRVKVVRAMLCFYCLFFFTSNAHIHMNILAFLLVHFPFFKYVFPSIVHLHSPNQIQASSLRVCVCVQHVSNLHLSLLSTSQAFRVRKQAKLQLLSVSWESGFCWAGCTRRKRRTSTGLDTGRVLTPTKNGVNMDKSRAKALEKEGSSWQQADLDYPLDSFFTCAVVTKRSLLNACDSQGRSLLLLATWAQEAVLEYLLCGATGGIFKCQEAKESSRCCSWSSYWG